MGLNELKALKAALDRQEATTGSTGAVSREPKASLLDASDVQKAHPEWRVRWIQVGNPEKAQLRTAKDGYTLIPAEEGGRRVGGLALAQISQELYQQRTAEIKRQNKLRVEAYRREMEQEAEAIARALRDRHGIDVPVERLLVNQ